MRVQLLRVRVFTKRKAFYVWLGVLLAMLARGGMALPWGIEKADAAQAAETGPAFGFPKVPPSCKHMRLLLENAFRYIDPVHGIVDRASGYPVEGWNQDPGRGLFLRSFTQLTAVGEWIELLANIVAGYADNPYVSRESAMAGLSLAVQSLLEDQSNPSLAAKGLLVNFLSLEGGKRSGPLLETVEKKQFIHAFGHRAGEAVWQALLEKGWILEQDDGGRGKIRRGQRYGEAHFDGALAPYAAEPMRSRIMGLLDQRVVQVIFGDNANLTASVAKSIGALLRPQIRNDAKVAGLRREMERFLDAQKQGYLHLLDSGTGTFFFGWDATADRWVGWDDGRGNWMTGQMNYFINEFRGPWKFVVLRYGLPQVSIRNAGFKVKPYPLVNGRDAYALAAWEGSAFQLLGLSLFMQELRNPAWSRCLETLVDIELDFSGKRGLPGFLSEAYSGKGAEYTGRIGIRDIAVTDKPLITHAPSLYTLGVAFMIAPEKIEKFLEGHWPTISRLFTSHGVWEGWDTSTHRAIPYQTTVHTLSLLLGGIGSAPENMCRYLEERNLRKPLEKLYMPGERLNLLDPGTRVIPWTSDHTPFEFLRETESCRFSSALSGIGGMSFVVPGDRAVNLSNGKLVLRYRSKEPCSDASLCLKRGREDPFPAPAIPPEIVIRLRGTGKEETEEIIFPATPALSGIKEIAMVFRRTPQRPQVDLRITGFEFIPFGFALEPEE